METVNATIKGSDNQVWAHAKNVTREDDWYTGKLVLLNTPDGFLPALKTYSDLINSGVLSRLDEWSEKLRRFGTTFQFENKPQDFLISDFYLDGEAVSVKMEVFPLK